MGTYKSLAGFPDGVRWMMQHGYVESCRCHPRRFWLQNRPADHLENGPYMLCDMGTLKEVGTSDKLVEWRDGKPVPMFTRAG